VASALLSFQAGRPRELPVYPPSLFFTSFYSLVYLRQTAMTCELADSLGEGQGCCDGLVSADCGQQAILNDRIEQMTSFGLFFLPPPSGTAQLYSKT
jgi:hypothetical protein